MANVINFKDYVKLEEEKIPKNQNRMFTIKIQIPINATKDYAKKVSQIVGEELVKVMENPLYNGNETSKE